MTTNADLAADGLSRYFERSLSPGRVGIAVFVALVVIGFVIYQFYPRLTNEILSSLGFGQLDSTRLFLFNIGEPTLRCVLAFLAGFLFPRGFWLWGIAIVLHTPLSMYIIDRRLRAAGIEPYVGGTEGMISYFVISAFFALVMAVIYTTFSILGAFSRYPFSKRRATRQSDEGGTS